MVCVLFSHTYHMTHHVISLWCDTVTCDTFLHSLLCSKSKIKEKKRKRKGNINNDLVVLPSYDMLLFPLAQYSLISYFWFRLRVSTEASSTLKVTTVPLLKAFSVKVIVLTDIYKLSQDLVTYPIITTLRSNSGCNTQVKTWEWDESWERKGMIQLVKYKEYRRVSTVYIPMYHVLGMRREQDRHEVYWVKYMP